MPSIIDGASARGDLRPERRHPKPKEIPSKRGDGLELQNFGENDGRGVEKAGILSDVV
jgi:hypothetical protein